MWTLPWISASLILFHAGHTLSYSLPQDALDPTLRAAAIRVTRDGFTYGPPVSGGPYYPAGVLGLAKAAIDVAQEGIDTAAQAILTIVDEAAAAAGIKKYNGLDSVEDYTLLYEDEWVKTLPSGPAPGVLTNYSQDLFFSMERLANNPFSVRRLTPGTSLPFDVDDASVGAITGSTLAALLAAGRLFYADHSDHARLARTTGKYGAACSAYFYISAPGQFLPLAIRTNTGADLIYTPADSVEDWLLAKILFNINDFYFSQEHHLAATHEVIQIIWMAAIRSLSVEHPIHGLLKRLTYEVFALNPIASAVLFGEGAFFDQLLPFTGASSVDYSSELYHNASGKFQANYFEPELRSRGLLNATTGPALPRFPYHEDAGAIHAAIRAFTAAFVGSYYASDAAVQADTELQAWAREAAGPAQARDFPARVAAAAQLVDVLAHVAHLGAAVHHTLNTNALLALSATLPMHPGALYRPLPTAKGVAAVAPFLPPLDKALLQLQLDALFARPLLANTNRSLLNMFNDATFLAGTNDVTRAAVANFTSAMGAFSAQVKARTFDANGLSQDMPFVWQALDPAVAPFSLTI